MRYVYPDLVALDVKVGSQTVDLAAGATSQISFYVPENCLIIGMPVVECDNESIVVRIVNGAKSGDGIVNGVVVECVNTDTVNEQSGTVTVTIPVLVGR